MSLSLMRIEVPTHVKHYSHLGNIAFPRWEHDIPSMGTKHSPGGNMQQSWRCGKVANGVPIRDGYFGIQIPYCRTRSACSDQQRQDRGLVEGQQKQNRGKKFENNLQNPIKISNFAGKFRSFSRGRRKNDKIEELKS